MISIRLLKICDESICKPLWIIFRSCLENGKFPLRMEKSQSGSYHQKKQKQKQKTKKQNKTKQKLELKNCRPISLLPVSGKIFERFLYEIMFTFFTKSSFTSQNQSRFKPGDSCTKQLLPITYQISKSFHDFYDVLRHFQRFW